jgi:hypothetical protein
MGASMALPTASIGIASIMKVAATTLLVVALAVGTAADADAASTKRSKRAQTSPVATPSTQARDPMAQNGYSGYYQRIEDKVPFGSKLWWDVYSSMPRGG